ncbi:MAG TPA: hypothetical protein VKH81_14480 [Candidatus Angelobacter sp.]|nr:hypothetical protein [Candidatus Angelobacter sp.]
MAYEIAPVGQGFFVAPPDHGKTLTVLRRVALYIDEPGVLSHKGSQLIIHGLIILACLICQFRAEKDDLLGFAVVRFFVHLRVVHLGFGLLLGTIHGLLEETFSSAGSKKMVSRPPSHKEGPTEGFRRRITDRNRSSNQFGLF